MPRYGFRCAECNREEDAVIPVGLRDDPDLAPVCCEKPMTRIMSSVPFTFDVPPAGHYFPTIGKTCHSAAEFTREAEKVKKKALDI